MQVSTLSLEWPDILQKELIHIIFQINTKLSKHLTKIQLLKHDTATDNRNKSSFVRFPENAFNKIFLA